MTTNPDFEAFYKSLSHRARIALRGSQLFGDKPITSFAELETSTASRILKVMNVGQHTLQEIRTQARKWGHRMADDQEPKPPEQCSFCRFARQHGGPLQCHRFPPRDGEAWPEVDMADWCGEFRWNPRATQLPEEPAEESCPS
jgi:hypothetical protein